MDIAKYIGLFLLKNNFCYIHGLGNLELKKRPASYDGQALQAAQYEVALTPTGSIDDNLANFIATNEQVSISKASNSLKDFSVASRAQLQEGKDVIIPGIGKFVSVNGKISFVTDPHLQYTPPSIPALKTVKRVDEEPQFKNRVETNAADHNSGTSVNWGKIALWVVILGALATAVAFGINYMNKYNANTGTTPVADTTVAKPQSNAPVMDTVAKHAVDTTHPQATAAPAADPNAPIEYKVILKDYNTLAAAEKRVKQLTGFGNKVEVVTKDSASYFVVMPMKTPAADTTRVIDSLHRNFNPKGTVSIYR